MADYQAPLRDMRFVLNEVFDAPALWASLPKVAENVDPDTADAILEEAGVQTCALPIYTAKLRVSRGLPDHR